MSTKILVIGSRNLRPEERASLENKLGEIETEFYPTNSVNPRRAPRTAEPLDSRVHQADICALVGIGRAAEESMLRQFPDATVITPKYITTYPEPGTTHTGFGRWDKLQLPRIETERLTGESGVKRTTDNPFKIVCAGRDLKPEEISSLKSIYGAIYVSDISHISRSTTDIECDKIRNADAVCVFFRRGEEWNRLNDIIKDADHPITIIRPDTEFKQKFHENWIPEYDEHGEDVYTTVHHGWDVIKDVVSDRVPFTDEEVIIPKCGHEHSLARLQTVYAVADNCLEGVETLKMLRELGVYEENIFAISAYPEARWSNIDDATRNAILEAADNCEDFTRIYGIGLEGDTPIDFAMRGVQNLASDSDKSVLEQIADIFTVDLTTRQQCASEYLKGGLDAMMRHCAENHLPYEDVEKIATEIGEEELKIKGYYTPDLSGCDKDGIETGEDSEPDDR